MDNQFGLKASGEYREFGTGSRRDATGLTKPRPEYLSPHAAMRFGEHMRKGAEKYGAWNWSKGQPASEMFASMYRHMLLYEMGDRSEDHLAAILFGAQGIMHFEELAQQGDKVALDMLDAYASQKLADQIRGEAALDAVAENEATTNIQPMSEREFVQWHEGTPEVAPVPEFEFAVGDRVVHRNGTEGTITVVNPNGDCRIHLDGINQQPGGIFYPAGLMKNWKKID